MAAAEHVYVYYRLGVGAAAARPVIFALIEDVRARTGVVGELYVRNDDPQTWMEVYAPVRDYGLFAKALAAAEQKHAAAEVAERRQRHIERFIPMLSSH